MSDDFNVELFYRITRLDNNTSIIVKRDSVAPKLTNAGGRWNVVNRPRRTSFVTYDGGDPYRMDVPILFDGWDGLDSVEGDIAKLVQMRIAPADFSTPPQVKIDGAVPVKNATWVLEQDIDFGDNVIWHENNYRLRQDAVIHLLQFIPVDALAIKPPATSHVYTVKTGDTLKSISREMYGTTKYWTLLKNTNNIRDPKKLPNTIRIPVVVNP